MYLNFLPGISALLSSLLFSRTMSSSFGAASPSYHFSWSLSRLQVTDQIVLDYHLGDVDQLMKFIFLATNWVLLIFSLNTLLQDGSKRPLYFLPKRDHSVFSFCWYFLKNRCILTSLISEIFFWPWFWHTYFSQDFSIILIQIIYLFKGYHQCILNCFIFLQQFKRPHYSFFMKEELYTHPAKAYVQQIWLQGIDAVD